MSASAPLPNAIGTPLALPLEAESPRDTRKSEKHTSPTPLYPHPAKKKILPIALLFPGQGAQFVGMLSETKDIPAVKVMLETANSILGYDLLELCMKGPIEKLKQTEFCQPAVFVASLAAMEKLRLEAPEKVENCQAFAGFSIGEVTALCASGVLSFREALTVVKHRAVAMSEAARNGGAQKMVSIVGMQKHELEALINIVLARRARSKTDSMCQIANELFPTGFTISGTADVTLLVAQCATRDHKARTTVIPTSGAFHCPLMQPAVEPFRKACQGITGSPPAHAVVYSNVTAKPMVFENVLDSLALQMVSPVRWSELVTNMIADGVEEFVELGPGMQLKAMMRGIDAEKWKTMVNIKP